MMSERIYLASPHMGGSERRYVDLAFDTNWIAPLGANVTGFEQDLQQYLGAGYVTALSAGTAALHLAVRLAGGAARRPGLLPEPDVFGLGKPDRL